MEQNNEIKVKCTAEKNCKFTLVFTIMGRVIKISIIVSPLIFNLITYLYPNLLDKNTILGDILSFLLSENFYMVWTLLLGLFICRYIKFRKNQN